MTTLPDHDELVRETAAILSRLGVAQLPRDGDLAVHSPVTGGELARVHAHTGAEVREIVGAAQEAFAEWRTVPAPVRGALVRELGELLREHKDDLGALVSIEAGKIRSEGLGEVQEMIDICDLAVGLVPATVRPDDRIRASRSPDDGAVAPARRRRRHQRVQLPGRGVVVERGTGVRVRRPGRVEAVGEDPAHRAGLPGAGCRGGPAGGRAGGGLRARARWRGGRRGARRRPAGGAVLSATGSTRMGRAVAPRVAGRFGRLLLELGGNNAAIVTPSADLDLTVRGIVFSAAGTAGQRCTTLRRVIAHSSVADELVEPSSGRLRDAADRLATRRRDARRPADRQGGLRGLRRGAGKGARPTAASWSPAASGCSPTKPPTPTTCSRRSCGCRRRARSCRPRRSRRFSTSCVTAASIRPARTTSTRRWRCTTTCRRGCRRRSSR